MNDPNNQYYDDSYGEDDDYYPEDDGYDQDDDYDSDDYVDDGYDQDDGYYPEDDDYLDDGHGPDDEYGPDEGYADDDMQNGYMPRRYPQQQFEPQDDNMFAGQNQMMQPNPGTDAYVNMPMQSMQPMQAQPMQQSDYSWKQFATNGSDLSSSNSSMTKIADSFKNNRKAWVFGIVILVVLLVIGGGFILANAYFSGLQSGARNFQREDDLARIMKSVSDYQAQNGGETPFGSGNVSADDLTRFVMRYIDMDVTRVEPGRMAVCKSKNGCSMFKDPDGTMYGFEVRVANAEKEETSLDLSGKLDHLFHVVVSAECGSEEGAYKLSNDIKQIAIFYTIDNGFVACDDNR